VVLGHGYRFSAPDCFSLLRRTLERHRRQHHSVVGTDAPHEHTGSLPVNTCKPISLHVALHQHRVSMNVMCTSLRIQLKMIGLSAEALAAG
jgi:hypothetical protein